jgi:hypothetical protein
MTKTHTKATAVFSGMTVVLNKARIWKHLPVWVGKRKKVPQHYRKPAVSKIKHTRQMHNLNPGIPCKVFRE